MKVNDVKITARFDDIIKQLQIMGVVFDDGLKPNEIKEIEGFYNVVFPIELRELYSKGLPISEGFYNWRDKSRANVNIINFMLNNPITEIVQDLRDGLVWCDQWGKKPLKYEDSYALMMLHYREAPKLIPVYSHRYIPYMVEIDKVPIFSIHGTDIIYYGTDLISYLEVEFHLKKYDDIANAQYPYIPFWSNFI